MNKKETLVVIGIDNFNDVECIDCLNVVYRFSQETNELLTFKEDTKLNFSKEDEMDALNGRIFFILDFRLFNYQNGDLMECIIKKSKTIYKDIIDVNESDVIYQLNKKKYNTINSIKNFILEKVI